MLLNEIGKGITVNNLNIDKLKQTTQLLKKIQKKILKNEIKITK